MVMVEVVASLHTVLITTHASRLQEYKESGKQKSHETGITLIPNENNLFLWKAALKVTMPHVHSCARSCLRT